MGYTHYFPQRRDFTFDEWFAITGAARQIIDATNVRLAFEFDQPNKPPRYGIPLKYSDPSQTPLRQKVPPDGEVVVKLHGHG